MKKEELLIKSEAILKQRNGCVALCALLLVANLLLSASVLFTEREVVLIPTGLDKEAVIKNGKMSPEYLEAITRDVINLMLNVTPTNTDYASKALLKITHPKFYGQLKISLDKRNQDVIRHRVSIFFAPQAMSISDDNKSVIVSGKLSTHLGKEEVLLEDKIYSVTYASEGFRPQIIDFHEVTEHKQSEKEEGGHEKTI